MKTTRIIQPVIAAFFLVFAISTHAADVSVRLQPNSFPVDRAGQLSVVAENGDFDEFPAPVPPPGVSIRQHGRSTNLQIINGQRSLLITQNFVVSADKPGEYTIPSFEVSIKGQKLRTDPVSFRVTASNAPPISSGSQTQGNATTSQGSTGFLRLDFPERDHKHLYVGEMAPVRIKAYFPEGSQIQLRSAPRPEGQGFTIHNISDEPEQNFEIVNGTRYRTVTWFAGLSMAKAGEFPVTVGLDATVMIREKAPRVRGRRTNPFDSFFGGNSPFNDPFFDDFFDNAFVRTIPKEVTLVSPGDPLTIKPLPSEGRPENFSGAVGEFTLGGFRLPADARTGEPQKIRVTVNGKGNFDRLNAPTLEPADAWKTYKPKTTFSPGDVASFSGSKTFDFNAVPQKSGDQNLMLSFSYFDPSAEQYKTVNSTEIDVAVTGENVKSTEQIVSSAQNGSTPKANAEQTPQRTELAPIRSPGGSFVSLLPLTKSVGFWTSVGIALLGIASGFVIKSARTRYNDPELVAARQSLKQEHAALHRAEEAVRKGDTGGFFASARQAVQEHYGQLWNHPAEAITLGELRQQLPGDCAAIELFSRADAIAYAPNSDNHAEDLKSWQRKLEEILNEPATT
ncbi:MAG: BatD family protein [Verrucomicrobiales bacterium]|nr:BatD family protein [Verrucomicrobiales bacterium]